MHQWVLAIYDMGLGEFYTNNGEILRGCVGVGGHCNPGHTRSK